MGLDKEAMVDKLDGPEWDSSDEEETAVVSKKVASSNKKKPKSKSSKEVAEAKPKPAKATKTGKSSATEQQVTTKETSSVVYVGHLPAGFEEPELRGFMGQFGVVKRLKLARSRQSHRPRGYAFCEFDDPEVAQVVADTMSGYLMGQRRIVCNLVPPDKVYENMFLQRKQVDWNERHRQQVNSKKSALQMKAITKRLLKREQKKRKMLKEMGIEYDFPGYEASDKKFPVRDDGIDKETIDVADQDDDGEKEEEEESDGRDGDEDTESKPQSSRRRKVSLDDEEDGSEAKSGNNQKKKTKKKKKKQQEEPTNLLEKKSKEEEEEEDDNKASTTKSKKKKQPTKSSRGTSDDSPAGKDSTKREGLGSSGKKRRKRSESLGDEGEGDRSTSLSASNKKKKKTSSTSESVQKKKKKTKKRRTTL